MIPGKKELALGAVPDREGKHAGKPIDEALAPLPPAVHQHFAVAACDKVMAGGDKFATQGAEIVNLTVEDHRNRAVGRDQGLLTAFDIDDRQPPEAEGHRAIEITAVGVRPAMNERGDHRREGVARPRVVAEITGDAAHGSSSPAPCCFDAD